MKLMTLVLSLALLTNSAYASSKDSENEAVAYAKRIAELAFDQCSFHMSIHDQTRNLRAGVEAYIVLLSCSKTFQAYDVLVKDVGENESEWTGESIRRMNRIPR